MFYSHVIVVCYVKSDNDYIKIEMAIMLLKKHSLKAFLVVIY